MVKTFISCMIAAFLFSIVFLAAIDAEVARQERAVYGTEQTECLFSTNCWNN